jgi:hypothetical protein
VSEWHFVNNKVGKEEEGEAELDGIDRYRISQKFLVKMMPKAKREKVGHYE